MAQRCKEHRKQFIYRCPNCGRYLCNDCVETRDVGVDMLKVCRECNVPAKPVNPGDSSLWTVSGKIFKAPFARLGNFVALCVAAAFCGALNAFADMNVAFWYANIAVFAIIACTLSSFLFLAINTYSRGGFDAPLVDDIRDIFDDLILPGLRILFIAIASLTPLALYLFFAFYFTKHVDVGSLTLKSMQRVDLVMIGLLMLVALLYLPMAVGLASIGGSISYAMNPVLVIGTIFRAPGAYLKTVMLCGVLLTVANALDGVLRRLLSYLGDLPFVSKMIHWGIQFYGGFAAASLVGAMLYLNWDRLRVIPSLRLRPVAPLKKAQSRKDRLSEPRIDAQNEPAFNPAPVRPKNKDSTVQPITLMEMQDRPPDNWFVSEEINLAGLNGAANGRESKSEEPEKRAENRSRAAATVRVEEMPPLDLPDDLSVDLPPPSFLPPEPELKPEPKPESKLEARDSAVPNGGRESGPNGEGRASAPGPDETIPLDLPDDLNVDLPEPAPEPQSAAKRKEIESTCEVYRDNVRTNPEIILEPKLQWSVAGFFERNKKWPEAVEAYAKMGALGVDHPKAADGLLRAAYLAYKHLRSQDASIRFLRQILTSYPSTTAAEKARKVLESIWSKPKKRSKNNG